MKKIDIGQALAILANLGVIAGIVFVGIEINQNSLGLAQNTSVATAQAVFQLNESQAPGYRAITQDAVLAELVSKGYSDPDSLTELELEQFAYWLRASFNAHEASWFYYDNGLISEEDFQGYIVALCNRIQTAGGKRYWEDNTGIFAPRMVRAVSEWCY